MSSSAFALILTVINLILWVFFFVLLKKKFSPENVLDTIRIEVDKLLIVLNQETDRDLTLLEAKLSEIHEAMKYADYVLQQVKGEPMLSDPDYGQKIEMHQDSPAVTVSISEEARSGSRLQKKSTAKTAYQEEAVAWEQNMELFTGYPDQQPVPAEQPAMPLDTVPAGKSDDAGVRKVNRQQVIDLWQMGQSVAEIAQRLDVDMTTIQMIIDMFS